jgi:ferredoxin
VNFAQWYASANLADMAELNERLPKNVAGGYYVDSSCIDCDLCRNTAPAFFTRDDDAGFSFVHRQPATAEERALAEEAKNDCPTESIGNNGVTEMAQLA